jgi:menaquinone-specific isochorismate synthase
MNIVESAQAATRLSDALTEGIQRANDLTTPVLVSVASQLQAPLDAGALFAEAASQGKSRILWARPSAGWWAVGVGTAHVLTGDGAGRFNSVRDAHRALMETAVVDAPKLPGVGPVFFGGFRFDTESSKSVTWRDFGDGRFLLPSTAFSQVDGVAYATINAIVSPGADINALLAATHLDLGDVAREANRSARVVSQRTRSKVTWRRTVNAALDSISDGEMEKVVLARRLRLTFSSPPALGMVMERLMAAYPACLVFAIGQGNSTFLGATPEQLVSLDKGHVSVTCLAGSAPRGATVEQDEVIGNELLERHKDQREHAYVVQAVHESLSSLCTDVTYNHQPGLLKLPSVQHLSTHFSATASADTHVLDLAQALHPTPAVGGTPRNKAMEAIRTIERADRGWYAAPVGHIDASGDGEFGVAIRSALMQGNKALLYAGAGIVEGSEPDLELAEVELKLNAMRSVLAGDD